MGIWDRYRQQFWPQMRQKQSPTDDLRHADHGVKHLGDPLPEFPAITHEVLKNLPDQQLISVINKASMAHFCHQDGEQWLEDVLALPMGKRSIFVIHIMDCFAPGDGWEAFRMAFRDQFIALIPDALKLIGAKGYEAAVATVVEEVAEFGRSGWMISHSDIQFYYIMARIDRAYKALMEEESLSEWMIQFIRQNPAAFVDA
jgi:hypothetical protein